MRNPDEKDYSRTCRRCVYQPLDMTLWDTRFNLDRQLRWTRSKTLQVHITCNGNQRTYYDRIISSEKWTSKTLKQKNRSTTSFLVSEHQGDWDRLGQPLTYWYNNHPNQTTGPTSFNLVITRPPPSPIVAEIWTSAPPDMDFNLSSYQMQARILNRLTPMFAKA